MKKFLTAALVAAGVLTCNASWAELQYNYDSTQHVFTVKSEEVLPLDEGANTLRVAFVKRYDLGHDAKGKIPEVAKPKLSLEMFVEGLQPYEFADNANYWQEHNYTYGQIGILQALQAERQEIERKQKAFKAADEAAKQENGGKAVALTAEQEAERDALSKRDAELAVAQSRVQKTRLELKRNPSTLIYLEVENKLSREDTSKPLYEFNDPVKAQRDADVQALTEHEQENVATMPQNNMDAELAKQAAQRKAQEAQEEREKLAKLNVDDPKAAKALRKQILEREETAKAQEKLAKADALEAKIRADVAKHEQLVEEVKATRAAFLKYQQEQAEAREGIVHTSVAKGKLSAGDNFFAKVRNSLEKQVPFFFEVKFWRGGSNQRMWLQNEKLKELVELVDYDLYKDKERLDSFRN